MIAAAVAASLALTGLGVSNGGTPYAGDRPLLATVSPNADGSRDAAIVRFALSEPARVRLEAVENVPGVPAHAVWSTQVRLGAGPQRLVWRPTPTTPARTYVLRLTATGARGQTIRLGRWRPGGRVDAPVVRVLGLEASFLRSSYAPGELAEVRIAADARSLKLQVLAYAGDRPPGIRDTLTSGVAMTPPLAVDWSGHRDAPANVRFVRAGNWPSGLYFLRLSAEDGRVGYAPLIVRPRRLGVHRIAIVLATNTWQAYNFADANGDGWGDSWYVSGQNLSVALDRPYLDFGLPYRFGDWDLEFLDWLARTGKQVDVLSDDDLERATGAELARAYDLVVFPGHEEYATTHAYDAVTRYRDLGGNLAFLSANNFFWRVDRIGDRLVRVREWRELGRPEAALVGVQYVGSNHGARQAGYTVAEPQSWAFAGTGIGSSFGRYGIEVDARSAASPPGTELLASIPDLLGPGRSAEMTSYETPAGARVFAAGTLNFASSLDRPEVSQLVENVWNRLATP
ncbi:MAG: N,N-dimethylformamidase beta subunit family domain-containing protein [Gaiellaceae bacterium]